MNDIRRSPKGRKRSGKQLGRNSKNTYVTKSGQTIKVNQSLSERVKAKRDLRSRRKAQRLAGMPKGRLEGFLFRMHPQRLYKYWFSREGGIMALKVTGIGLIGGFIAMIGVFAYFRKDLPDLRDISGKNIGGSIQYFDRTGQHLLFEDYDAVKRIPVPDDQINDYVKDATIAIEDKDFFQHSGFDLRGIMRAGINNAVGGGDRQGGSTVTQQLVRLTQDDVGKEQTYKRKIKELILSIELERSYTKPEILTGYLNTAPYGNVQYGVEAAVRDYFQKTAEDITLDEAAFLAGIPKAPSYYSPYGPYFSPEATVGRQHYILDLMEQQGMITAEERDEAKKVDTLAKVKDAKPKYAGIKAPWFVLAAKERMETEMFTEKIVQRGGWKVITTLDMELQKTAEEQVKKAIPQINRQGGDSVAFVAEDVKTGQVVSLVGGSDFSNEKYGQNNYARYRLPPGSSFKPYDYLALMEHNENFGAGTVLYDSQGPIEGYPCTNRNRPRSGGNCLWNFDFRYPGPMTVRYALGGSRNVPAVKAMMITGIDKTIETANKLMGNDKGGYKCYYDDELTKEAPCYASSAIGDGAYLRLDEHVHGYASISRNGNVIPQTYILKIEDAAGKTVKQWEPSRGKQVVRPDSAYITADIMADPNASYFTRKPHRYNGHKFSLKTGTTNDAKDGWLMGFSTQYSAGVWVGSHNRQVEMSGFMENMTEPIWSGWMHKAHEDLEPEERDRPDGVQTLPAYIVRQHIGLGSVEPSSSKDLYPSWYKQLKRATNTKRTIDIVSNKVATECTPERAKKKVDDANAESFSGDTFVSPDTQADPNAKDDVHDCSDIKPSVRLTAMKISGSRYRLTADVTQGTHPLSSPRFPGKVNFMIDGQVLPGGSFDISSSGIVSMDYSGDFSGKKTVVAEVIDSVLYDSRDSVKINGSSNGNFEESGSSDEGSTDESTGEQQTLLNHGVFQRRES